MRSVPLISGTFYDLARVHLQNGAYCALAKLLI
jgi:hypothetical protein